MAVGVKIEDEERVSILLCSMPNSWDNLIMSLSLSLFLDLDSVVASLLIEELRRKLSPDPTGDAMVVRGRSTKRDNG